ncbi:MAG TPA: hypothetical protein VHV49_09360 [Pseudonocardiaceae bacterium]|nr:hypothetical protein [Pseudonocardiaceae bacterium]
MLDLIDQTIARAMESWENTLRFLAIVAGVSACAVSLMLAAHVLLGISPWISGVAGVTGMGAGSYVLARHRSRHQPDRR